MEVFLFSTPTPADTSHTIGSTTSYNIIVKWFCDGFARFWFRFDHLRIACFRKSYQKRSLVTEEISPTKEAKISWVFKNSLAVSGKDAIKNGTDPTAMYMSLP
ncbi:hypothetical protein L2E82_04445 [Cichorium intybus]|uniref:Uncharacterized protein n=1 Tax=Cichorium intybus TaxID=13427 RepID=A0ACB9H731_CICIN|nr:hypothetical protein L2E82_04445 [Cichorium intybus]